MTKINKDYVDEISSLKVIQIIKWLKRLLILFVLAWTANIASCGVQGTYQGATGNLCGGPETNGIGTCYRELPTGGFPITYVWDKGCVSVEGSLSVVGDRVETRLIWLNFGFYFGLFTILSIGLSVFSSNRRNKD